MSLEDNTGKPELQKLYFAKDHQGLLGTINDQIFYTLRYEAGKPIAFPFKKQPFSVLLNIVNPLSKEELETLAKMLLEHGLACAICNGKQAEEASEIIDESIDKYGSSDDKFTPYSSTCEEGIEEALQYFSLPTGITSTSLILTIGNENDNDSMMDTINNLSSNSLLYIEKKLTEEEPMDIAEIRKLYYQTAYVNETKYHKKPPLTYITNK